MVNTAFVFPGQGSQALGMLQELSQHYPIVKETFAQASQVLGYDLWDVVQNGPEAKLNQTEFTQPAMLVAGYSVWRVWQQQHGAMPQILAGHSLGEYTALVCAKALLFEDAVKLVAKRAEFMQQAVPEGQGAMAAIMGLTDDQVLEVCNQAAANEVISPANFNTIGQVVVAGSFAAVKRAIEIANAMGALMAKMLAVSVPAHCMLMQPAADKLKMLLHNTPLMKPQLPVINNVDVAIVDDAAQIRDALYRQVYSPVRWVEIVQTMEKQGIKRIVECGPGRILMKLNKRIANITAVAIFDSATLQNELKNEE